MRQRSTKGKNYGQDKGKIEILFHLMQTELVVFIPNREKERFERLPALNGLFRNVAFLSLAAAKQRTGM